MPIAFALYRVGIDPARLAADPASMRLMVLATRQAFTALRANGNDEVPTNLRLLYRLPTSVVIGYWRRVLKGPEENCGSAHTAAPPPRRCTHSHGTCKRRCARPGFRHPTSSGYWPPPP